MSDINLSAPGPGGIEHFARLFHEVYERRAPDFQWETQFASKGDWTDLPRNQRLLMLEVVGEVIQPLLDEMAEAYASRDHYLDRTAERLAQVTRVRELADRRRPGHWYIWPHEIDSALEGPAPSPTTLISNEDR